MDDKNLPNTPTSPATPEAPSTGGINFDQLLITNQEPETVSATLNDHLEKDSESAFSTQQPVNLLMQANDEINNTADKPVMDMGTIDIQDVSSAKLKEESNLLSLANDEIKKQANDVTIDISNIDIEETRRDDQKKSSPSLGSSGIGDASAMLGKLASFNYRKIVSIALIVLVVSLLVSGGIFLRTSYLNIASQPRVDPTYQTYMTYAKDYQKLWSEYTSLNDYSLMLSTSFVGPSAAMNVGAVLNSSRLSYVQKKDIFQNGLNGIGNDIVSNYNTLDGLKQDVAKYGFFPKDLLSIFGDDQEDISIKRSLMSLEVVKFSTAIKVFSYLDTFIKGLANLLGIGAEEVQNKIKTLDERGDKDIKTYLNTCYLNPYEIDESCKSIGDFDKYYTYYEKSSTFDTNFFKKLMYYIDLKLEQSDLPNFSINFQRFDPKQKQISFTIEVDTFKQDEASLIMQGILNPHIFVVTQLLNLLKQSLFVIGENIDAKQIRIQPKVIQVGSAVFPANSSSMNFVLPIQKNPQREIADFILNKDYYFTAGAITGANAVSSGATTDQVESEAGTGEALTGEVTIGDILTGEVTTGDILTGETNPSAVSIIQ